MKKLCSILLALVFAMSLCTGVLATDAANEEGTWDGQYTASDTTSFTIKKTYTSTSGLVPGETLKFNITCTESPVARGEVAPMITIGQDNSYMVTENSKEQNITVTVPSYSVAGIYKYTISETNGQTAGVTYTNKTIRVAILVEYDNDNHKLVIGNKTEDGITYFIENTNDTKTDTFENTFSTGSFTVAKDVQGNMANETDEFSITVTLTSAKQVRTKIKVAGKEVEPTEWKVPESSTGEETFTYTTTLKLSEQGGATTFANIPAGVKVSVVEDAQLGSEYTLKGYVIDNGQSPSETAEFTVANGDEKSVVVVNEKTKEVDTGVNLDSLPYILLLLAVCAGLVFFVTRKSLRRES